MSDVVIRAEALGKRYVLGERQAYKTLREAFRRAATAPMRAISAANRKQPREAATDAPDEILWALRDVSFDVKAGEVLGVIGRNGAGKSTLLKILSRITEPTTGRATILGKVGSLLEVGTGFHPELTGRENIYLSGAIIGMKRAEINRKLDQIVAFSEIERFLDTPVKRYSSGMYVRLAFAVAAHLEPEILLVDEVLAVGDASFQKKCLGKMGDVANECRTVETSVAVFVGEPSETEPRVVKASVETSDPNRLQRSGAALTVLLEIDTPLPVKHAAVSIQIADMLGKPLAHLWSYETDLGLCDQPGMYRLSCTIPDLKLYMGRYSLIVHFADAISRVKYQTLNEICPFEVVLYGRHRDHYDWAEGECVYFEDAVWHSEPVAQGHSGE